MFFSRKRTLYHKADVNINGERVNQVERTKFLGVTIDAKLTWKEHIALVRSKLSRCIGMVIKAKQLLNQNALITLYYSFFYPYLTYCTHVWGSTYNTNTKLLYTFQKKILRIIAGFRKRDSVESVFLNLKLIKFPDINSYLICKFMFRYHKGEVPEIFANFFTHNSEIHRYFTRQHNYLHIPLERKNFGKFNIRYRGAIIWNHLLSLGINPDTSEACFMKSIKKGIINGSITFNN